MSRLAAPFEQIDHHHHAGLAGHGGSSYIDLVICRDQIDNSGDPPVATRDYVLQNWRADVVALAAPDGDLRERTTYDGRSLYEGGIPFATHPTDLTTGNTSGVAGYGMPNGTLDANDYNYFLTLYGNTDFRADWNRDGVFDTGDSFTYLADYTAATGSWGRGVPSNRTNILGYAGYIHEPATGSAGNGHGSMYHCHLRVHHAGLGRWIQRDPPQFEYGEGMSLYWYGANSPLVMRNSLGAFCEPNRPCSVPGMSPVGPGMSTGGNELLPGGYPIKVMPPHWYKGPLFGYETCCESLCSVALMAITCCDGTLIICDCFGYRNAFSKSSDFRDQMRDCVLIQKRHNALIRSCAPGQYGSPGGSGMADRVCNEAEAYEIELACVESITCNVGDEWCEYYKCTSAVEDRCRGLWYRELCEQTKQLTPNEIERIDWGGVLERLWERIRDCEQTHKQQCEEPR